MELLCSCPCYVDVVKIEIDFHADFREIVESTLRKNDVAVDASESYNDAVYRYYANVRRRVAALQYKVLEAAGLTCPADLATGYSQLKAELENGYDVTSRLSRKMPNATFEDRMLNDWGIVHFHLGERDAHGGVPGTKIVLFALVRDETVYAIGFFDHKSWSNIEVLEIVDRNWPALTKHVRVQGIAEFELCDEDRAKLRAAGANMLNTVNGQVLAPLGGGYTMAGTSMAAHKQADRAILSVGFYQDHITRSAAEIVADLERQGFAVSDPPRFRFGFHADGSALATEATACASFILGPFPR